MSMEFRDLALQAAADGAISAEEIFRLRQAGWADGRIDPEEAEALFVANEGMAAPSPEWCELFVEALSEFVVNTVEPHGYVDQEMADELVARIDHDGKVASATELELLVKVLERATSVPVSLKRYALLQVEHAVLSGEGPSRVGETAAHGITAAECRLLTRAIHAPASDGQAGVGADEAELLFRIKDATLHADNAEEWSDIFVKGVAQYLLGFGGDEPLTAERAEELEHFMASPGAGIGGFLGRMAQGFTHPTSVSSDDLRAPEYLADANQHAAEAAQFTPGEHDWLQRHLDADHELDALEKALLKFIAEETGEVFGMAA